MAKTGFSSCIGCNSAWSARLIVIRGNSASGKSAVAAEIRRRHGRGLAIVGQDNLRRQVLRERDVPGAANIDLIDLTARFALDRGFHVIVEGILYADRYGAMLTALIADRAGAALAYYLDVPWAETLRRHASKPQATEYGEREMRAWYRERDLLPGGLEQVIPDGSALDETVRRIMAESGLGDGRECPEGP
jgi:predicted kinase